MSQARFAWALTPIMLLGGCDENKFSGTDGVKHSREHVELPCAANANHRVREVRGPQGTDVVVDGEFCLSELEARAAKELTVMFLLDHSGSMKDSDPLKDGSCGRLKAAQAIVKRLTTDAESSVSYMMGQFSRDGELALAATSAKDINSSITAEQFCGFIVSGKNTNYEAAFDLARSALQNRPGRKVVYFLTDGSPTFSNKWQSLSDFSSHLQSLPRTELLEVIDQIYDAGEVSAKRLHELPGLVVYTVYLDYGGENPPRNPKDYLVKIMGDESRVRIVQQADQFASEIVTFAKPPDLENLTVQQISGELDAGPNFPKTPINILELTADPERERVWRFSASAVELKGMRGSRVTNTLTFKVNLPEFAPSTATVHFELQ